MVEILDIGLSLITLTILEIVLGIDNLVFIAIISQKLPQHQQKKARRVGLAFAWVTRLLLLASVVWITKLTKPLFTLFTYSLSGRDLFLLVGGIFLLFKATQEIHQEMDPSESIKLPEASAKKFVTIIIQIALLDIVFSLDSILTAIGLTDRFWLMALAITIAILTMIFASEPLSRFIKKRPSIKMLALSFLILIGMVLIADGLHSHIPRGYIYFAMGFSLFVEALNILKQRKKKRRATPSH